MGDGVFKSFAWNLGKFGYVRADCEIAAHIVGAVSWRQSSMELLRTSCGPICIVLGGANSAHRKQHPMTTTHNPTCFVHHDPVDPEATALESTVPGHRRIC